MSALTSAALSLPMSPARSGFVKPAPRRAGSLARVRAALVKLVPLVASPREAKADLAKGYASMAAACRARGRHTQAEMFDQMAEAIASEVS